VYFHSDGTREPVLKGKFGTLEEAQAAAQQDEDEFQAAIDDEMTDSVGG